MATTTQDFYDVLGVARDADAEAIRRAYRTLARRYHPDVNKQHGAEERFKAISEAYEVLSDPDKRARYDQLGANWRHGADMGPQDFGGFTSQGFGSPGGFGDVRVQFADGDLNDLFGSFFGGGRAAAGGAGASARGADHEASLELSLEEAAAGGKRSVALDDGRTYDVQIPAGVRDGQRIRLAGEGARGRASGPSGDLFLRVHIAPHPRFSLDGRDVRVDLPVTPWEAALGATVQVPTLDGSAQVRVPAGTSSGRRLRLRGQGFPGPRGGHGDLYATVKIVVPKQLSDRERELFEQLAESSTFRPRGALR